MKSITSFGHVRTSTQTEWRRYVLGRKASQAEGQDSRDLVKTDLEAFSAARFLCPAPAVERKAFKPFQVRAWAVPQEVKEMHESVDCNSVDGMFDTAGVGFRLLRIKLQSGGEEFPQSIVPTHDILSDMAPFNGQGYVIVRTVMDQPSAGKGS